MNELRVPRGEDARPVRRRDRVDFVHRGPMLYSASLCMSIGCIRGGGFERPAGRGGPRRGGGPTFTRTGWCVGWCVDGRFGRYWPASSRWPRGSWSAVSVATFRCLPAWLHQYLLCCVLILLGVALGAGGVSVVILMTGCVWCGQYGDVSLMECVQFDFLVVGVGFWWLCWWVW